MNYFNSEVFLFCFCCCCCFLGCISCLYILAIKPLLVTLFANIFFPFCRLSLRFLMVSFAVQKLVRLSRSHLFIFVFISIVLGDPPKKTLVWFMSEDILPIFFLGALWCHVLCLSLYAILNLFLCLGVRVCSKCHWFTRSCLTSPTPFA